MENASRRLLSLVLCLFLLIGLLPVSSIQVMADGEEEIILPEPEPEAPAIPEPTEPVQVYVPTETIPVEPEEEEAPVEEPTEIIPAEEPIVELPELEPEEGIAVEEAADALIPEITEFFIEGESTLVSAYDGSSVEDRLNMYLYSPLYGFSAQSSDMMEDRLNPVELILYRKAKAAATEIANGRRASTIVNIPLSEFGLDGTFTAADLGVSQLVSGSTITTEAANAMRSLVAHDSQLIFDAVLADCPFEMYWSDLSCRISSPGIGGAWDGDYYLYFNADIVITFYAVPDFYNGSNTQVNTAKTAATSSALQNAQGIIASAAGLGDQAKLRLYAEKICELNTYNDSAAAGNYSYGYGNPWQMIYVFDGDPSTNVVCEGYSKAFQYLCEMTNFSSGLYVYHVSGTLSWPGSNGGPHMWNIVHLPGVGNRLVDVTNCDKNGFNDELFLAVPEGSVETGYHVGTNYFFYDSSTLSIYTKEELSFDAPAAQLAFTTQPTNQTVRMGELAVFQVAATGNNVVYLWQSRASSDAEWQDIEVSNQLEISVRGAVGVNGMQLRCIATDSQNNTITSNVATLTVTFTPTAITTQPTDLTLDEGTSGTIVVVASGDALSYQWQVKAPDGDWMDIEVSNYPDLSVGAYAEYDGSAFRCIVTGADGNSVTSDAATLTVRYNDPEFVIQPDNQTVSLNDAAAFHVEATGKSLTYQWQYKMPSASWKNCSSATAGYNTDTLMPVGTAARNGYQYRCIITDANGKTATSDPATLTVKAAISITVQPVNQTVNTDSTAVFQVEATGTNLHYQWQYKMPSANWKNCSSATVGYNTDILKPVGTTARNGYQYRCIITDASGNSAVSDGALLTVQAAVTITTQPTDQTVSSNATATFRVAASGNSLTYQWQYKMPSASWKNCSSATVGYNTTTLKPVGTTARDGYQYRCIVKDAAGNTATSNPATLTVQSAVSITAQPANQTVNTNGTAVFHVEATGTYLYYQWQYKMPSASWKNCSSATVGYNTNTLKPVGTTARNGYQYRCIVTDVYGNTATSNPATLTVQAAVSITAQPANQTVNTNATAVFQVTATGSNLTYQWQYLMPSASWKNCSSATVGYNTNTLKPVGTTARNGYQYRCIIKDANGNTVTSNPATLTVQAAVAITAQPGDQVVNANDTAVFQVTATGSNLTYQWQYKMPSGSWKNSSSATVGYNTNTLKPVGTTARNGYQYRCIIKDANGNTVTSNPATLTVQ